MPGKNHRTKSGRPLTQDELDQAWADHEEGREKDRIERIETQNRNARFLKGFNY